MYYNTWRESLHLLSLDAWTCGEWWAKISGELELRRAYRRKSSPSGWALIRAMSAAPRLESVTPLSSRCGTLQLPWASRQIDF